MYINMNIKYQYKYFFLRNDSTHIIFILKQKTDKFK